MAHNVKFIKDQEGVGKALFEDIHIGGPHIATDSFYLLRSLLPELIEKTPQGLSAALFATPQQALLGEIVDLRMVDMAFLARDLVNANVEDILQIFCRSRFSRPKSTRSLTALRTVFQ
jgi:hypothetical protein